MDTEKERTNAMSQNANPRYHRFFEGYTEQYEELPNGKKKIRRIYTGTQYDQDLTKQKKIRYRLLYWLAFLGSVAAFILSATVPAATNLAKLCAVPTIAAVFLYLWAAIALIYYSSLKPRTIYEYRLSHIGLLRSTLALIICHSVGFFLHLILMLLAHDWHDSAEYLALALLAASVLLAFILFHTEKRCPYTEYETDPFQRN